MDELSCRFYLSDGLKAIADNTARMFGGQTLNKRYADIVLPQNNLPVEDDPRSCVEIAADVWRRIRGET